jgi:LacI family transcriptional regulator
MIRPHTKSNISDQRERGFRDALREYGIPMDEDYLVSGITRKHAGFSEEAGVEAINILLSRNKLPQAVFCSNDAQAIGAIHSLEEKGYSVPKDIAVMGYDNIKISRFLNLTTIDQKMYEVGKASIKRLAERIRNNELKPLQTTIKPELVVRKSTINSK